MLEHRLDEISQCTQVLGSRISTVCRCPKVLKFQCVRALNSVLRMQIEGAAFDIGQGRQLDVTVSIGVASLMGSDESALQIMKRADEALYEAKNTGRNKVVAHAA